MTQKTRRTKTGKRKSAGRETFRGTRGWIAAGTLAELRSLLAEKDLLRFTGLFQPVSAREALQRITGIEVLQAEEDLLVLSLADASGKLTGIFSALAESGAEVRGTILTQPSLESLFIKLTGKELRE